MISRWCESCQKETASARPVMLDNDPEPLPICDSCWSQMTPGVRMKIANDFRQQRAQAETVERLEQIVEESWSGDDDDDDPGPGEPFNWFDQRN